MLVRCYSVVLIKKILVNVYNLLSNVQDFGDIVLSKTEQLPSSVHSPVGQRDLYPVDYNVVTEEKE